MSDTRHKNSLWNLPSSSRHGLTWDHVQIAVLMDIRDELQQINKTLNCYRVPRALDALHELGIKLRREKRGRRKRQRA